MCVTGLKYFSPTEKKKNGIPYATYPPPGLIICYILLLLLYIFSEVFEYKFRYISPLIFLCIFFLNDIFLHKR